MLLALRRLVQIILLSTVAVGSALAATPKGLPDSRLLKGYLDKQGNFKIRPQYTIAGSFVDNQALVNGCDKYPHTCIDTNGHFLFKTGLPFDPRGAHEQLRSRHIPILADLTEVTWSDELCEHARQLCPRKGQEAVDRFANLYWPENQGKVSFERAAQWLWAVKQAQEPFSSRDAVKAFYKHIRDYGLNCAAVETEECGHNPPPIEKGGPFAEDLARVCVYDPKRRSRRLCYINRQSKLALLLGTEIVDAGDFHEGLAAVRVKVKPHFLDSIGLSTTAVGFIDKSGKLVIPARYENRPYKYPDVRNIYFSEGLACLRNGNWCGAIDRHGVTRIPFIYPDLEPFRCGLAVCSAVVDKTGRVISVDDLAYGYQSIGAYRVAYARALQPRLKDIRWPQQFRFQIDRTRPSIISGDAAEHTKTELLNAIASTPAPPRGVALDSNRFSLDFVLQDGKVFVGHSKEDPCADLILKREIDSEVAFTTKADEEKRSGEGINLTKTIGD